MTWKISQKVKNLPVLKDPILIEGLPGIGNVGKVAVDFIIEELGAKRLYEFFSYSFPHSVFINEENLVELPTITLYYKKFNERKNDLLLLAGDIQPIDEESCYRFTEKMLDILEQFKGSQVVTLGGIGLQNVPKTPKVYCTGNSKKIVKEYMINKTSDKLYGIVGPIVGVSGLLPGLAKKRDIAGVSLLAETFGHPMYLGVKGAKEILKVLDKKHGLELDLKELDNEIKDIESEMLKRTKDFSDMSKQNAISKMHRGDKEVNYIG